MRAVNVAITCSLAMAAVCSSVATARDPEVHQVAIRGMKYIPATLEVSVGDTVVWTNDDPVKHTVTSVGAFDSQTIEPKKTWSYTATRSGDFPYGCTFHPSMKGTLKVR